jgi:hypothetical protein
MLRILTRRKYLNIKQRILLTASLFAASLAVLVQCPSLGTDMTTKVNTRDRLDSFEERFVELCPLQEELDFAGKSVGTVTQARERIADARRVVAEMVKVLDQAEAALT